MKANQKLRTNNNAQSQIQSVVLVVALLLTIVIGVMVYFEVIEGVDELAETTEVFTGYTLPGSSAGIFDATGSNATQTIVTLTNSPYSTDNSTISVVCRNTTGSVDSSPAVKFNSRQIIIPASPSNVIGTPLGYNQIRVTYTSNAARSQSTEVTPMAQTIFTLLPIIALVVVAAIILAVVLGFGGSGKSGGGL